MTYADAVAQGDSLLNEIREFQKTIDPSKDFVMPGGKLSALCDALAATTEHFLAIARKNSD